MKDSRALLMDQFTVMINTECYYVVSYDEGSKCIYNKQPPKDDDSDLWRRKICLWYFRVVDHLQMYAIIRCHVLLQKYEKRDGLLTIYAYFLFIFFFDCFIGIEKSYP